MFQTSDAGIVHQHVETAAVTKNSLRDISPLVFQAHIEIKEQSRTAEACGDPASSLDIDVRDIDECSFGDESMDYGFADPSGSA